MEIRRVLVVYKVSLLRRIGRQEARRASADLRARWIRSDVENRAAVAEVVRVLARTGWKVEVRPRGERFRESAYQLIVVVGGDGTLFDVARHVRFTPIMAVNSDPPQSLALFSCGDYHVFGRRVEELRAGRLRETRIRRMRVWIGRREHPPVWNDVLFAHRDPAMMSRYEIASGRRSERQFSSGLWVATAAGSTAAILAAGGRMMPIGSDRLQWRAREPYVRDGRPYRLAWGETRGALRLRPLEPGMVLWMDGARNRVPLDAGVQIRLDLGAPPARILGFDDARRRMLFAQVGRGMR
jgi:NAD+ kinase